ncbi:MAG: thermonuclease family protein [Burkholderiales bacterium]|nr:thermonuclease family protein [Burkholderiales bacterium]MDP2398094.1 thermonuclease family protein [Burkholderiales bacterium]
MLKFILLFFLATPVYAFTGKVVSIADGDTLTVLVDRSQVRIRLADIDAPEKGQDFGDKSRQSLGELCHGKTATVSGGEQDRFGRTLGTVNCDGVDANAEQVRRGMAWVFDRYAPKDSPLYSIQDAAKASRRGLWSDPNPTPPWQFRRGIRR